MSVGVSVAGIMNVKEGKLKDMLELKALCDKQDMDYPKRLVDFFEKSGLEDWEDINVIKKGTIEISLYDYMKGDTDTDDGAIITLADLPKEVKQIRIYMS